MTDCSGFQHLHQTVPSKAIPTASTRPESLPDLETPKPVHCPPPCAAFSMCCRSLSALIRGVGRGISTCRQVSPRASAAMWVRDRSTCCCGRRRVARPERAQPSPPFGWLRRFCARFILQSHVQSTTQSLSASAARDKTKGPNCAQGILAEIPVLHPRGGYKRSVMLEGTLLCSPGKQRD